MQSSTRRLCGLIASTLSLALPAFAGQDDQAFIQDFHHIKTKASTVPGNGDVNPYGVAVVPVTTGALVEDHILISNFNNSTNLQGTGTTIVEISPSGVLKVFATIDPASLPEPCPGGIGLTTALVALRSGFVVVGSLPTTDGTAATAQPGCLIVLDSNGKPVLTLAGHGINGPWDMAAQDLGYAAVLFVTNVLNGTVAANGAVVPHGSVMRILLLTPSGGTPREVVRNIIASGFDERSDPAALVVGPTGLGIAADGRLFVADTVQNRIAVIPNAFFRVDDAGAGMNVSQGGALNGPLGLTIAPNGDILTVNGGDGNIVEITPGGEQVAVKDIDVSQQGGGTLFGLAISPKENGVYFVDDGNNTLDRLH
jgi:hypothetical protein